MIHKRKNATAFLIKKFNKAGLIDETIISQVKLKLQNIIKASFMEFSSSINTDPKISEVWSKINPFCHKSDSKCNPNLRDVDFCEAFMDNIDSPGCFCPLPTLESFNYFETQDVFNSPFNREELTSILDKVKDSVHGLDDSSYSRIKNLPVAIKNFLLLF